MTIPSTSWDESSPAGSQGIKLGDNRIRELKTQIREVVDVDHKFDSSGQDSDMGKHNKVSFLEAADIGTGAEGKTILGGQTVNSKCELVYTDEDDNDVVITSGGGLSLPSIKMTDGNILIGQADGTGQQKAMSGNATIDNTGAVTFQVASEAQGDIIQRGAAAWERLAKGTAYQKLFTNAGATALEYGNEIEIYDYGTSLTSSTQKRESALMMAFGTTSSISAGSSVTIQNLPFTSAASYTIVATRVKTSDGADETAGTTFVSKTDGGNAVIRNTDNAAYTAQWLAIGV